MTNECTGIELSINARNDGSLEAAYVQVSDAPVATTREVIKSVLLVDLDENGELVGVEILAPVKISQVQEIASSLESPQRESFERFLRKYVPSTLLTS